MTPRLHASIGICGRLCPGAREPEAANWAQGAAAPRSPNRCSCPGCPGQMTSQRFVSSFSKKNRNPSSEACKTKHLFPVGPIPTVWSPSTLNPAPRVSASCPGIPRAAGPSIHSRTADRGEVPSAEPGTGQGIGRPIFLLSPAFCSGPRGRGGWWVG